MKNHVNLIGRLGKDPESSYTVSGLHVAKFTLATSFKKETTWHNIATFGKTADNVVKYLKKGSLIEVEGNIKYSSFEKDGVKRYFTEIIAQKVRFLSPASNKTETIPAISEEDDLPF